MPNVEENKTVDIDTSGPGAEIELQEEKDEAVVDTGASSEEKTEQPSEDKTFENERETKLEEATEDKKEDDLNLLINGEKQKDKEKKLWAMLKK
jgi:hypothetical protein